MRCFVTDQDLKLKRNIFPYLSPQQIPLSFRYGGRLICGIPDDYIVSICETRNNENTLERTIVATNDAGLEIRAQYTEYMDFPATEWLVLITNRGNNPTELISDIRIGGVLPIQIEKIGHGNGDTCTPGGFDWHTDPLTKPYTISPSDGTSCKGAFPYMRLLGKDYGINLAIGWTGKWITELKPVPDGVCVSVGQARCSMRILPGETMRTPRLTCVAYSGSETKGLNLWRRWYLKHILPSVKPMCCMHYFKEGNWPEFTGATQQGQLNAIDTYLRHSIHPDVLWMDAGWYPCDHKWNRLGNWQPDPERFPEGLSRIGKKCAEEGIEYLLWFEPERTFAGTQLEQSHPEWMLRMTNEDGIVDPYCLTNLADPQCREYITDLVDSIIKESGVTIYRQDFNFDPYPRWVQNEASDRIGALENLHIQGYYRFWDELRARNPGLLIDSCASGGRRNDLETMRRSVPLHYTDVGYGIHPIKQLQHRRMFEWIPYFRAHVWSWDHADTGEYETNSNNAPKLDKYAFYVALAPAITDMLDHRDSEERYALSQQMQPIWRKAADLMLQCDYYPLTECRASSEDFYAMVFYSPEQGDGFLNVVSNNANPETHFTAVLDMLDTDAVYVLTEAESERSCSYTGAHLAAGLTLELSRRSGLLFFIQKV